MTISKELLVARLQYLMEIADKPDQLSNNVRLADKVKAMIYNDEIHTYMAVESVYYYLKDKADPNDEMGINKHAREIADFIN